jgi:integrase
MFKRRAKTWQEFRERFNAEYIAPRLKTNKATADAVTISLNHFERICTPDRLAGIDAKTFDAFLAKRRKEGVSDGTIGKDLDHVRMALNHAHTWKLLAERPEVPRLDDVKRLVRFVTPDDFRAIYRATKTATTPKYYGDAAQVWWKAVMVTIPTTGWFLKEVLALRWDDVDLDAGVAVLRPAAGDRRRRRAKQSPLPPVVVEHLERLPRHKPEVFGWPEDGRQRDAPALWLKGERYWLWQAVHDIQEAAAIHLECPKAGKHPCTVACRYYSFDDLRASATVQACAGMVEGLRKRS